MASSNEIRNSLPCVKELISSRFGGNIEELDTQTSDERRWYKIRYRYHPKGYFLEISNEYDCLTAIVRDDMGAGCNLVTRIYRNVEDLTALIDQVRSRIDDDLDLTFWKGNKLYLKNSSGTKRIRNTMEYFSGRKSKNDAK